jgi:hypothetical protein
LAEQKNKRLAAVLQDLTLNVSIVPIFTLVLGSTSVSGVVVWRASISGLQIEQNKQNLQ